MDFPDLTADGSFPWGVRGGWGCYYCQCQSVACLYFWYVSRRYGWRGNGVASCQTGHFTAFIQYFGDGGGFVYAVNLRIMQAPNLALLGEPTIFGDLVNESNGYWMRCLIIGGVVIAAKLLLDWFFSTETGLAMRATGSNLKMAHTKVSQPLVVF